MENPLFDCFSDDIKDAVLEVVLKSAIARQGETDGWPANHMQRARDAVFDAARDLLEAYEENFHPGNHINVLEEEEVMAAQSNLLNSISNNSSVSSNSNSSNSNNSSSTSNSNNSNNSSVGSKSNNSSNSNNVNKSKNGNQKGGKKTRRARKTRRNQRSNRKN